MRGDQWYEQKDVKEERERARGVLLYFEERYEQVDEKITGFYSFPKEIKAVYRETGRKLVQDLLTPRMQKFREANQA